MELVGFFKSRDEKFSYTDLDGEGEWGGCQKSRQVNGVQVSCQHNCPVDQSICLHADMSVHRLVYLSTNINNKKHHLTSYIKKNSTLRHDVYIQRCFNTETDFESLLGCELK